jgi:rRNA maturation endonuclease Nob1
MSKYDGDQQFDDPVVRCTGCTKILFKEQIQKIGKCVYCGCRKVRTVDMLSDSEIKLMKNKKIDSVFQTFIEWLIDHV